MGNQQSRRDFIARLVGERGQSIGNGLVPQVTTDNDAPYASMPGSSYEPGRAPPWVSQVNTFGPPGRLFPPSAPEQYESRAHALPQFESYKGPSVQDNLALWSEIRRQRQMKEITDALDANPAIGGMNPGYAPDM